MIGYLPCFEIYSENRNFVTHAYIIQKFYPAMVKKHTAQLETPDTSTSIEGALPYFDKIRQDQKIRLTWACDKKI
jgi:hypothetical protein